MYNGASGQTHLLDPFSEWVLREIEGSPVRFGELVDRLVGEADLEEDLASGRLCEVLTGFDAEGLVEPGRGSR